MGLVGTLLVNPPWVPFAVSDVVFLAHVYLDGYQDCCPLDIFTVLCIYMCTVLYIFVLCYIYVYCVIFII